MLEKERLFSNQMLVKLIFPLIIEQTLSMLVGLCDGIMVSSAGEAAISGVSLVDMINNVILKLFVALATGGAVVTSQFLGARDGDNARKSAGQLVLLSGLFGLGIMIFCLVFCRQILNLFFGAVSVDVMAASVEYLRITALSFPFIALYNAGAAIFRSLGNSKVSMRVSMVMNGINVAGNALCIYGLKMGVAGVAIPTLVSRMAAAGMILCLVSRSGGVLRLQPDSILRIRSAMMKKILKIGLPSATENTLFQLGRVLVVSMIALCGTTHTSANAVAVTLDTLTCMCGSAISLAMITVVGQAVGAQDEEQVRYYTKKLLLVSYVLQVASSLAVCLLLPQLIGLYSSLSPETERLAAVLVRIHAIFGLVLWPASFVLPNALRAANDVRHTMWVSVLSMILFRLSLSWLLCVCFGYGAVGVWIAMVADWVCRTVMFVWRWCSGKWKAKCGFA